MTKVNQLVLVKIAEIQKSPWNPPSRVSGIGPLRESIERHGLLQPVLVDKSNNLVDGHRRLAACEALGWEEIPAVLVIGNAAEIYGEVTTYSKKPSGNEMLYIYLNQPAAVAGRVRAKMELMEEELGRPLMQKMQKQGLSWGTWKAAHMVCNYLDRKDSKFVQRVVRWMMHQGSMGLAQKAVTVCIDPKQLLTAIARNRPLKASFVSE